MSNLGKVQYVYLRQYTYKQDSYTTISLIVLPVGPKSMRSTRGLWPGSRHSKDITVNVTGHIRVERTVFCDSILRAGQHSTISPTGRCSLIISLGHRLKVVCISLKICHSSQLHQQAGVSGTQGLYHFRLLRDLEENSPLPSLVF